LILKTVSMGVSRSCGPLARPIARTKDNAETQRGAELTQRKKRVRIRESESDVHGYPPTRVFLEKRLQAVENKGRESEIERKEAAGY